MAALVINTTGHANMLVAAVGYGAFWEVPVLADLNIGNRGKAGCCYSLICLVAGCISRPSLSSYEISSLGRIYVEVASTKSTLPEW